MNNSKTILARDNNGKNITIEQVEEWLQSPNKENKQKLADLFYYRFYGRYLKPFDFPNKEYRDKYKSGFAIMTSCCLLIETFVSFTVFNLINTDKNSERCFGYFFQKYSDFNVFAKDGLAIEQYENLKFGIRKNNSGIPKEFYQDVRNGLLHSGETKNGWKIKRTGKELFDEETKTINSFKFMNRLKAVMNSFRKDLIASDFDNDQIWNIYKLRLRNLIDNS